MSNNIRKETESVISEIMDAWLGHINRKESALYQDFYDWCEEIAEYRISLREENIDEVNCE
jgi:hypothetical protein